jgi:putative Mn2+ efflux pump MntP
LDFPTILLIAIGLAMDCLAVSVSSGCAIRSLHIGHALQIAFFFGFFQALMPVIGWLAGLTLRGFVMGVDHWTAFVLLGAIGLKMLYEAQKLDKEKKERDPLNLYVLLMLSVATSIDALAVGITFAFMNVSILFVVSTIGVVTFVISLIGVFVGDCVGHLFEKKMEMIGGFILIGIGIKILIEHLFV